MAVTFPSVFIARSVIALTSRLSAQAFAVRKAGIKDFRFHHLQDAGVEKENCVPLVAISSRGLNVRVEPRCFCVGLSYARLERTALFAAKPTIDPTNGPTNDVERETRNEPP